MEQGFQVNVVWKIWLRISKVLILNCLHILLSPLVLPIHISRLTYWHILTISDIHSACMCPGVWGSGSVFIPPKMAPHPQRMRGLLWEMCFSCSHGVKMKLSQESKTVTLSTLHGANSMVCLCTFVWVRACVNLCVCVCVWNVSFSLKWWMTLYGSPSPLSDEYIG